LSPLRFGLVVVQVMALALLGACANDDRSLLTAEDRQATEPKGGRAGSPNRASAPNCPDLDGNGVPDCTETLVSNPSFDSDSSHWRPDENVAQSWLPMDATPSASSSSGSLRVENSLFGEVPTLAIAGTSQCIAISGGSPIEAYVQLALASGGATDSAGALETDFYSSEDCSGDIQMSRGSNSALTDSEWRSIGLSEEAPQTAHSLQVRLVAIKPFSDSALSVLFDNVLVRAN
jgi:hypothetical protein